MDIDELITLLIKVKHKHGGDLKLYVERSSMMECVYNNFRSPSVFIDVYDSKNCFKDTFEIDIEEEC